MESSLLKTATIYSFNRKAVEKCLILFSSTTIYHLCSNKCLCLDNQIAVYIKMSFIAVSVSVQSHLGNIAGNTCVQQHHVVNKCLMPPGNTVYIIYVKKSVCLKCHPLKGHWQGLRDDDIVKTSKI